MKWLASTAKAFYDRKSTINFDFFHGPLRRSFLFALIQAPSKLSPSSGRSAAVSAVGAGCSGSANYYKQAGQFHTSGPQPGDQIFFTKDGGKSFCHTGIVEKVAGGRVYTIEGNTSSAAGVVENGGCVQDKSYPLTYSKIGGYGRPDFSIVPEEDNDMDQTKFNEMFAAAMAEYRKQLRDNDSGDWSQKAREWAVSVGLFAGNGTLDNGEPNMMWEDFLTREQAAQLFYRFALEHGLA